MKRAVCETTVVVTESLEGSAVLRWRDLITEAAELRPERLVIDLRQAPSIDGAAVVVLLQTHRKMLRADGRLVLRAPVERVRRMLALARIDRVLDVEN